MLDRFFDNYIMTPMQKIVFYSIHAAEQRDGQGVAEARTYRALFPLGALPVKSAGTCLPYGLWLRARSLRQHAARAEPFDGITESGP